MKNHILKLEISRVVDTMINLSKIFECDIDTIWWKYTHPIIKEQYTLKEIKEYIVKNNIKTIETSQSE